MQECFALFLQLLSFGLCRVQRQSNFQKIGTTSYGDFVGGSQKLPGFAVSQLDSSSAAQAKGERRLPDAIIIGVKKGGTRALLEFLRIHPQIRAPGPEIHFFDRHYDRGLEWYRRQMPLVSADHLVLEKTPSYFVTKEVPARVAAMNPATKILLVVRNPVTRALSDYAQNSAKRPNMPPFDQLAFTNATGQLEVDPHWGAVRLGIYWRFLRLWLQEFPMRNIHIVSGERLVSNPVAELAEIEDFLGLKPAISQNNFYFNKTKGFPCLRKRGSKNPHCLGRTKGRTHPVVDPSLIQRLRNFYSYHNEIFSRIVNRRFHW